MLSCCAYTVPLIRDKAQPESHWILLITGQTGNFQCSVCVHSLVIYISTCPRMEVLLNTLIQQEPIQFYFFPKKGIPIWLHLRLSFNMENVSLLFHFQYCHPNYACHVLHIVFCRTLFQEIHFPLQGYWIHYCKPQNCIQAPAPPLTKCCNDTEKIASSL